MHAGSACDEAYESASPQKSTASRRLSYEQEDMVAKFLANTSPSDVYGSGKVKKPRTRVTKKRVSITDKILASVMAGRVGHLKRETIAPVARESVNERGSVVLSDDFTQMFEPLHPPWYLRYFTAIDPVTSGYYKMNSWIIHPDSRFVIVWTLALLMAVLVSAIYIPWQLAFSFSTSMNGTTTQAFWHVVQPLLDVFFLVDIFVQFRIAHAEDGVLIQDPQQLASRYLKTWVGIARACLGDLPADADCSLPLSRSLSLALSVVRHRFHLVYLLHHRSSLRRVRHAAEFAAPQVGQAAQAAASG